MIDEPGLELTYMNSKHHALVNMSISRVLKVHRVSCNNYWTNQKLSLNINSFHGKITYLCAVSNQKITPTSKFYVHSIIQSHNYKGMFLETNAFDFFFLEIFNSYNILKECRRINHEKFSL